MLVLSRKLGETICIGDDVTVTVVDIDRGKIRLGIVAPRDVPVHRKEVKDMIDLQHAVATAQKPAPAPEPAPAPPGPVV